MKFLGFSLPAKRVKQAGVFLFCVLVLVLAFGAYKQFVYAYPQGMGAPAPTPQKSDAVQAAASGGDSWSLKDALITAGCSITLWIATLFLKVTVFILSFVIELGAYNGYLDSPAVNIGWVMVRDIANMFFVAILLVIAFGTILGIEQYEWRKMLVKFVLAAILVNFSRLICGVIIDAAQVIMVTFINGVAATAGGNLINAFKADQILKIAPPVAGSSKSSEISEIFMASVLAVVFSAMMMATMGVYLFMLLARMIILWVLIVLSPLAFVLSVVPQTQKYASQWWDQFGNNVISGPIIVFFLWLSFATVGGGNIHDYVGGKEYNSLPNAMEESKLNSQTDAIGQAELSGSAKAGISKVGSWANMANFFIAIGMMLVGAKVASQLGVVGGAAMTKAVDFGKKVGMIASGYTAGRWIAGGVASGAKRAGLATVKGVGKGLYHATIANTVETTANWAKRTAYQGWRAFRTGGPRTVEKKKDLTLQQEEKLTQEQLANGLEERIDEKDGKRKIWNTRTGEFEKETVKELAEVKLKEELTKEEKMAGVTIGLDDDGKVYKFNRDGGQIEEVKLENGLTEAEEAQGKSIKMGPDGKLYKYDEKGNIMQRETQKEKVLKGAEALTEDEKASGIGVEVKEETDKKTGEKKKVLYKIDTKTGKRLTQSEYDYERDEQGNIKDTRNWVQKQFYARHERLLRSRKKLKRATDFADNREKLMEKRIGADPEYFFQRWEGDKKKGYRYNAMDRVEQGMLKAEEERSSSKTEEFQAYGRRLVKGNLRFKDSKWKSEYPTMSGQIQEHKAKAEWQKAMEDESAMKNRAEVFGKYGYLTEMMNMAEMGKKAAENFVKTLKDGRLKDAFKTAAEAIENIIEGAGEDPEKIAEAMKKKSEKDVFVASLRQSQFLAETQRLKQMNEKTAGDTAYDAVVSLAQGGRTPSTAKQEAIESYKKDLNLSILERKEGQKLVADRIAFLMQKRIKQGGNLSDQDQLALTAAFSAVDLEAWNDDVFDHIFAQVRNLANPNVKMSAQERTKAEGMKKLTEIMRGWGVTEDSTNIVGTYGRQMSRQLQALAGFGGDFDAVGMHDDIENNIKVKIEKKKVEFGEDREKRIQKEQTIEYDKMQQSDEHFDNVASQVLDPETYKAAKELAGSGPLEDVLNDDDLKKIDQEITRRVRNRVKEAEERELSEIKHDYWGAATKVLGDDGVKEYEKKLKDNYAGLQYATREFTKNAYANGHAESAHDFQYDTGKGMIRPQTIWEAEEETNVDLAKKTPSELAKYQMHSYGDMDVGSHLYRKISEEMYRGILGQIDEEYQLNAMPQRTLKKHFGLGVDETAQLIKGKAIFGASEINKTLGAGESSSKERGAHVIADYILPMMKGNHKAFLFEMKRLFGNVSMEEANHGVLNLNIDGFGEVNNIKELLEVVRRELQDSNSALAKKGISFWDIERLEQLAQDAESENGFGLVEKRGGNKRSANSARRGEAE